MSPSASDDLLGAILDGSASPEDEAHFQDLLGSDPAFQAQAVRQLRVDALLASLKPESSNGAFARRVLEQAEALSQEDENSFLDTVRRKARARRARRGLLMGTSALAAALAVAMFFRSAAPSPVESRTPVVAALTIFDGGTAASPPRFLSDPETINLTRGRAKLTFASGCVIALQAPATVEILDDMTVRLQNGRLNGFCPPSAHGFRVMTPEASLVDLGTSFGVSLIGGEESEFVVFDGEVRVEHETQKTVLRNGHSLRLKGNQGPTEVPFEGAPYKPTWLLAEGIVATSGAVIPVDPDTPEGIAGQRDDFHVLISPEKHHVSPDRPLRTDLREPGTFTAGPWEATAGLPLSPGAVSGKLSSFLLHARVERVVQSKTDHVHYQGSVTFAEPVVAVIASQNFLKECDELFATGPWKQIKLPINNRGLEGNLGAPPDRVTLSPDRLTLTIDFHTGYGIDELRVLTRSPAQLP